MPRTIKCSICGATSPYAGFGRRMKWLRRHRKRSHPKAFRESIRKAVRTRKARA